MDDRESVTRSVAVDRRLARNAVPDGITTERVELARTAGRTLAESVDAPTDVPQYDPATTDGLAVAAGDDYPSTGGDDVRPEDDPPTIDRGEAVAVMTGAASPTSADTVQTRERGTVDDGQLSGPSRTPEANVYSAGERVSVVPLEVVA